MERNAEDPVMLAAELGKTLKEGERIVAPTRRPDGTLRKPLRIRSGYVPPDEVAKYQSKGAIWRKEMLESQQVPPGYDQVVEPKLKSKAAKRKKRQQASLDKNKNSEERAVSAADNLNNLPDDLESVSSKMDELSLSVNSSSITSMDSTGCSNAGDESHDIDKKIRALKKKIRLAEAQKHKTDEKSMNSEQLEKMAKLEGWRNELKLLEDKKSAVTSLS